MTIPDTISYLENKYFTDLRDTDGKGVGERNTNNLNRVDLFYKLINMEKDKTKDSIQWMSVATNKKNTSDIASIDLAAQLSSVPSHSNDSARHSSPTTNDDQLHFDGEDDDIDDDELNESLFDYLCSVKCEEIQLSNSKYMNNLLLKVKELRPKLISLSALTDLFFPTAVSNHKLDLFQKTTFCLNDGQYLDGVNEVTARSHNIFNVQIGDVVSRDSSLYVFYIAILMLPKNIVPYTDSMMLHGRFPMAALTLSQRVKNCLSLENVDGDLQITTSHGNSLTVMALHLLILDGRYFDHSMHLSDMKIDDYLLPYGGIAVDDVVRKTTIKYMNRLIEAGFNAILITQLNADRSVIPKNETDEFPSGVAISTKNTSHIKLYTADSIPDEDIWVDDEGNVDCTVKNIIYLTTNKMWYFSMKNGDVLYSQSIYKAIVTIYTDLNNK